MSLPSLKMPDHQQVDLGLWASSSSDDELSLKHVHPRKWGKARKVYDTSVIMFLEFFTTMISTAGTPIAGHIHRDLGIGPVPATCIFVSTYLVGQTLGGVIFPPWSESFGRKNLYVFSTGLYSMSCLLGGKFPTIPGIVIGRFIGGLLSAIPTIVATGSIEDMWDTQARVWWVFWWALLANIGLLTGPVFSDLIMAYVDWVWAFYTAAIVTGCVTMLFLTIKESRPSVVLAKALPPDTDGTTCDKTLECQTGTPKREKLDLLRPLRLLFTEPIVFLVAFISAIAFGLVYLFTEVLPMVYASLGFENGWKNLPFLALGIGMILSILTRFYDLRVLKNSSTTFIAPESKFAGFLIGAPALAIGLWWFAWTIPPHAILHWAIPTAALIPIGYAVNEFDYVLAGYLSDCYETYTASSFAALALTRSFFCATFPLFGGTLFHSLNFNNASSLFATLATVLCIVPPILLRYGSRLRARSAYANK
ncbi:MFS multidrug transporter [Colletotrichum truncatum]|uniref:MFS multidrug transporter n=1 Tax=Colletotrichum truncatum TaxID=5467 RepID=A0ACC3YQP1_COLTU|nr:MFS multidrug transporter [Colletotrichum truncatum]KAF6789438.1 MFS multidrug transporter [Colletotrichum truncatum]